MERTNIAIKKLIDSLLPRLPDLPPFYGILINRRFGKNICIAFGSKINDILNYYIAYIADDNTLIFSNINNVYRDIHSRLFVFDDEYIKNNEDSDGCIITDYYDVYIKFELRTFSQLILVKSIEGIYDEFIKRLSKEPMKYIDDISALLINKVRNKYGQRRYNGFQDIQICNEN
jgi:hypothetical protein